MFNFGTTESNKPSAQIEDLFESALAYENSLEENTLFETVSASSTPLAEKVRIRAYSDEYYKWIGKAAPRSKKRSRVTAKDVIRASSAGKACKACNSTGQYRLHKYNKDIPCAKCAGKGHITPIDEARSKSYFARKASGKPMDNRHTDYVH